MTERTVAACPNGFGWPHNAGLIDDSCLAKATQEVLAAAGGSAWAASRRRRIFVASMQKTASTSIGTALAMLGLRDCGFHEPLYLALRTHIDELNALLRPHEGGDGLLGHFGESLSSSLAVATRALPLAELVFNATLHCDSFSDYPLGLDLPRLSVRELLFPGSQYIWVDRPTDEWLASLRHHSFRYEPGQREHWGNASFATWASQSSRAQKALAKKSEDRLQLQAFATSSVEREARVLWLNISELSFRPLASFLGRPLPATAFPMQNLHH
eukprot:Transcript_25018.p1 GENE.Transcript_25018~~Transcript_25018.p1  ORF type:complete len:302 (-),score=11.35 Transcript_25018:90-902(-)